ncbi:AI-2E family transporter [Cytophagaceae bacterium ABcell3]|nr:AI-2E family transporter [Cytophagaceae bacterium ABcell3]
MEIQLPTVFHIGPFVIIQFVENNILTPAITGGKVALNPFVTILSLIFGSMIWGVAGMFIIVPYMAMVRIILEHIDYLKPLGFLMSDKGTEKYALSGEKIKGVFKKQ